MYDDAKRKQVIEIYENKAGNISQTCKAANLSRRVFYQWKKEYADFAEAIKEVDDSLIDMAESSLLLQIKKGNMTGIIFFLTNKASDRWKHKSEQTQRIEFEGDLNVSDKFKEHAHEVARRFNLPL